MKAKLPAWFLAMTFGSIPLAQVSVAQTTIQIFGPINVAPSTSPTNYSNPNFFNTSTLNLTCPTSAIQATLSGPAASGGNLLVDNNIIVTVTPTGNGQATPANVCPVNGTTITGHAPYNESCFTGTYQSASGSLAGQNPDTYMLSNAGAGGVPPIDISPYLSTSGTAQNVTIALVDEGGSVAGSSVFLTTNCTQGGVTGPATVSGNQFNTTDTTTLAQTFNFDTGANQKVGFVYDVSQVDHPANGTTPQTSDQPLSETDFQTKYVPGTSFATSSCLIHDGELLPDGVTHACKLFTLKCTDPATGISAGANCPVSVVENEVVKDLFDGPQFSLPNIITPFGVVREGVGFLMASDDWSPTNGGPCLFDSNADPVSTLPCPQNLLTSFNGPGAFASKGLTTNPNSTFVSIAGVPQDSTSILVPSEWPGHWSNTHTPKVYFSTQAPNLSKGALVLNSSNRLVSLANAAKYVPAPIKSITYGISPASNPTPPLPINEPIAGDLSLTPATVCPTILPTAKTQPNFNPPAVTLASLADGRYLMHYYAQDCAGTQELLFALNPPNAENENLPYWSTNFYTREINIDTTPPVVATLTLPTPPPGGSYKVGSVVYASYSCTDATTGAGVVLCGLNVYLPENKYATNTLTTRIDTLTRGSKTFTVYTADGAGNTSSRSINYTVVR